ncbi:MAG: cytochrome c oxidase subunit II [Chthonomonas sp.]|nr:cytochrome c oxidase subunit II [Chthonomonas sp.]
MNNWTIRFAPEKASNFAGPHDALFYTISALAAVFTLIVGVMVIYFVAKYRRGTHVDRSNPVHDNHKLEMIFLGIPTLLGLGIFAWSSKIYLDMRTPPKDAYEIFVIGKQWMWHVQHPNGVRENNEIHLPIGRPVKVTMISQDVIHGFYLPEMRVQYHVVPGRYTQLWFEPTKTGKFHLFCTIHCGTQHSEMGGYVYVNSQREFDEWLASGGNRFNPKPKTIVEQGKYYYDEFNCGSCHGPNNTSDGPSLVGIYNTRREFENGTSGTVDQNYIRESIINPYGRITKGYDTSMPVYEYKKQISEEQLLAIVEYIRSMTPGAAAVPASAGNPTPAGAATPAQPERQQL